MKRKYVEYETIHNSKMSFVNCGVPVGFFSPQCSHQLWFVFMCEGFHVHKVKMHGAESETCVVSLFCHLVKLEGQKYPGTFMINCSSFLMSQRENLKLREVSSCSSIRTRNGIRLPSLPTLLKLTKWPTAWLLPYWSRVHVKDHVEMSRKLLKAHQAP